MSDPMQDALAGRPIPGAVDSPTPSVTGADLGAGGLSGDAPTSGMPVTDPKVEAMALAPTPKAPAPPTDDALSGYQPKMGFAQQMAQAADKLGIPPGPGGWAKSLVAGAQSALAGAGAVGTAPSGAGFLYGAGKAAAAGQARDDEQKQQAIANARANRQEGREDQRLDMEKQKNAVYIAHENIATRHDQMLVSQLGEEAQQKSVDMGKKALAVFTAGRYPAPIIQQGVTSDQIAGLLAKNHISGTENHVFPTGVVPVEGQKNADGGQLYRVTYDVIGDSPEVTLDKENAQLISKFLPGEKVQEGDKMSGAHAGTLIQQATSAETAKDAIDLQRKKLGIENMSADDAIKNHAMLPDWNTALAKTNNDPEKALKYMQTDPTMKQKYPNASMDVMGMYGGAKEWETMRNNREVNAQKWEDLAIKKATAALTAGGGNAGGLMTDDMKNQIAALPDDKRAFLQQYSPSVQGAIMAMGTNPGDMDFNQVFKPLRKGQAGLTPQEAENAIHQVFPNWTMTQYKTMQTAYKAVTTGQLGNQIASYSNVLEHAAAAVDVFENNVNGLRKIDPMLLNKPLTWVQNHGYSTQATEIQNSLLPVREEYASLMNGGHAVPVDVQKAYDAALNPDSTPTQIYMALKTIGKTGLIRLENINGQYKRAANGRNIPGIVTQNAYDAAVHLGLDNDDLNRLNELSKDPTGQINRGNTVFHNPDWKPTDQAEINKQQLSQQGTQQANHVAAAISPNRPANAEGTAPGSDGKLYFVDKNGKILGLAPR